MSAVCHYLRRAARAWRFLPLGEGPCGRKRAIYRKARQHQPLADRAGAPKPRSYATISFKLNLRILAPSSASALPCYTNRLSLLVSPRTVFSSGMRRELDDSFPARGRRAAASGVAADSGSGVRGSFHTFDSLPPAQCTPAPSRVSALSDPSSFPSTAPPTLPQSLLHSPCDWYHSCHRNPSSSQPPIHPIRGAPRALGNSLLGVSPGRGRRIGHVWVQINKRNRGPLVPPSSRYFLLVGLDSSHPALIIFGSPSGACLLGQQPPVTIMMNPRRNHSMPAKSRILEPAIT
ncbi:hypothetical protein DFH09DRAFT_1073076 [Mycena vulgaris]|nr:hypothetical protein DFH09DRAFT_1073076 [Mycena vulgaris]